MSCGGEAIERTNSLLEAGEFVYIARQSGLVSDGRRAAKSRTCIESWLPDQESADAWRLRPTDDLLLAGINGGVARSPRWRRKLGGASVSRAGATGDLPGASRPASEDDGCALAGALEDGVFRSTDRGRDLASGQSRLVFDHSVYALALSPHFADDGVAYVGTGSGIYRSENGGSLWWDLTMPCGR